MSRSCFPATVLAILIGLRYLSPASPVPYRVSFQESREIRALIDSLATGDEAALLRSSTALKEKGTNAVPFLISELKLNSNPRIRYQVARILAQTRDHRGVDALFQASQLDPDEAVRAVAGASLDALIELLNTPQLGDRTSRDYKKFDRRSVFSLRRRLRTESDLSVRQRTAETLGEYGDHRDLDALFDAAGTDPAPQVRSEALKAIVKVSYPILLSGQYRVTFFGTLTYGPDSFRERIVRALIRILEQEKDASVRLETVKGLTRLVFPTFLLGEQGFGPLLALRASSREVILRVRNCLISHLRDDESSQVRREVAVSLSRLFTALFDRGDQASHEEVRRSLITEKRAYYFYPYWPGRITHYYRRTLNYFPSRAEHLLKPVREVLLQAYCTDPDPQVRREAVTGLSYLGRKSDSKSILDHLRLERNVDVYLASIQALGQLGGASAAEALLNLYLRTANSPELRKTTVLSIGRIGDKNVLRRLASFVEKERDPVVKVAILEALGSKKDEQTAAVLAKACLDANPDVRAAAAMAAAHNFTDETLSTLKHLLRSDPSEKVRAAACTSLSKAMGREAADILIAGLRDAAPVVRRTAAVELGIMKAARSLDSLAHLLLSDPDISVRAEAATSIGNVGGHNSVQPLISAVSYDTSSLVRDRAVEALRKTDEPRSATLAILAILPKLATENPPAFEQLDAVLPHLRQQAHGRNLAGADGN